MKREEIGELQEIEYSRDGKPMKRCPVCREWIRLDRLKEHTRSKHPRRPKHQGPTTICGDCGKEIPRAAFDSHDCTARGANAYVRAGSPGLGRRR